MRPSDGGFFPTSPLLQWLRRPWPRRVTVLVACLATLAGTIAWPWLTAGLLLMAVPLPLLLKHWTYGWRVDQQGVNELRWRREILHRWATLDEVVESPGALVLQFDDATLRLPWTIRGARELATWVRDEVRPPASEAGSVDRDQIAQWLQFPVESGIVVKAYPWISVGLKTISLGLLVAALVQWRLQGPVPGAGFLISAVCAAVMHWYLSSLTTVVNADGLRQGRRWVAWSDVTGLQAMQDDLGGWMVHTRRGRFRLPDVPDAHRVVIVVDAVLMAKQAGAALPRMEDVPEHAISRAKGVDASAERGISRAEE